VLGGKPRSHPGVIDVEQFVFIARDELLGGEEEDVVSVPRGIGEVGRP
jgi:hypothetical protein